MIEYKYAEWSYRQAVFILPQHYAARIMVRFPSRSDWFFPFFTDLFACQHNPKSNRITIENLTEEEKLIIKVYIPILLVNFMNFNFMNIKFYGREFISGLVLFRVEILPMFQKIFDPNQIYDLTPFNIRLNYWEKHFKQVVMAGYMEGIFKGINCRYLRAVTKEVRATQKWWNDDYNGNDDRIDSLADEYALMD